MSATATAPVAPAPTNGHHPTPAEFVAALAPDDKHAVFLALLKDALSANGDSGLLPVHDEAGQPFGYYVSPKAAEAASARVWEDMPDEVRAVLSRPVADLSRTVSATELLDGLRRSAG